MQTIEETMVRLQTIQTMMSDFSSHYPVCVQISENDFNAAIKRINEGVLTIKEKPLSTVISYDNTNMVGFIGCLSFEKELICSPLGLNNFGFVFSPSEESVQSFMEKIQGRKAPQNKYIKFAGTTFRFYKRGRSINIQILDKESREWEEILNDLRIR